jgi:metal-responsive CopG/Arc/MetJ family transcriptional regulator
MAEEIQALADHHGLSRSQAIRDLLESALIAAAAERQENAPITGSDWEALRADKNFDWRIWEHMAQARARYTIARRMGDADE